MCAAGSPFLRRSLPKLVKSRRLRSTVAAPLPYNSGPSGMRRAPYLVDLGQRGPHGSHGQPAPAAVLKQPPGGALPARAEHPAGGLLPLQGAARRLVPAQLRPPLAVAVGRAGLSRVAGAFGGRRAGGHALGDVLVVRRRASLVGAAITGEEGGELSHHNPTGQLPPPLSHPVPPSHHALLEKDPTGNSRRLYRQ